MPQLSLTNRLDALRWEFLRRSEGYRTVWKHWQAMKRKGASAFRLRAEGVLLALQFGLPQLYDPARRPGAWGPEFTPALPIRPCSPHEAVSRMRYQHSPRLQENYALLI